MGTQAGLQISLKVGRAGGQGWEQVWQPLLTESLCFVAELGLLQSLWKGEGKGTPALWPQHF